MYLVKKSAVGKLSKYRLVYRQKTVRAPNFASISPMAPNISSTLSPFDLCIYTELGADRLQFTGVIPERLIFRIPKVITIYRPKLAVITMPFYTQWGRGPITIVSSLGALNTKIRPWSRYYSTSNNSSNSKSCIIYPTVPFPVILSDL